MNTSRVIGNSVPCFESPIALRKEVEESPKEAKGKLLLIFQKIKDDIATIESEKEQQIGKGFNERTLTVEDSSEEILFILRRLELFYVSNAEDEDAQDELSKEEAMESLRFLTKIRESAVKEYLEENVKFDFKSVIEDSKSISEQYNKISRAICLAVWLMDSIESDSNVYPNYEDMMGSLKEDVYYLLDYMDTKTWKDRDSDADRSEDGTWFSSSEYQRILRNLSSALPRGKEGMFSESQVQELIESIKNRIRSGAPWYADSSECSEESDSQG